MPLHNIVWHSYLLHLEKHDGTTQDQCRVNPQSVLPSATTPSNEVYWQGVTVQVDKTGRHCKTSSAINTDKVNRI